MKSLTNKAFVASVLGIVFLTACGGGVTAVGQAAATPATPATSIAASGVVAYMGDLQATSTSDSAEASDISLVDMEVDDTAEPGAV